MLNLFRIHELSPADRRAAVAKLDRLTGGFAAAVMGFAFLIFGFHVVRFALRAAGIL